MTNKLLQPKKILRITGMILILFLCVNDWRNFLSVLLALGIEKELDDDTKGH